MKWSTCCALVWTIAYAAIVVLMVPEPASGSDGTIAGLRRLLLRRKRAVATSVNQRNSSGAYKFSYNYRTKDGVGVQRQETSDTAGAVTGYYAIQESDGQYRVVNYVADKGGFRAQVLTNQPGGMNLSFPSDFAPISPFPNLANLSAFPAGGIDNGTSSTVTMMEGISAATMATMAAEQPFNQSATTTPSGSAAQETTTVASGSEVTTQQAVGGETTSPLATEAGQPPGTITTTAAGAGAGAENGTAGNSTAFPETTSPLIGQEMTTGSSSAADNATQGEQTPEPTMVTELSGQINATSSMASNSPDTMATGMVDTTTLVTSGSNGTTEATSVTETPTEPPMTTLETTSTTLLSADNGTTLATNETTQGAGAPPPPEPGGAATSVVGGQTAVDPGLPGVYTYMYEFAVKGGTVYREESADDQGNISGSYIFHVNGPSGGVTNATFATNATTATTGAFGLSPSANRTARRVSYTADATSGIRMSHHFVYPCEWATAATYCLAAMVATTATLGHRKSIAW